jgi:hypothetical protein
VEKVLEKETGKVLERMDAKVVEMVVVPMLKKPRGGHLRLGRMLTDAKVQRRGSTRVHREVQCSLDKSGMSGRYRIHM